MQKHYLKNHHGGRGLIGKELRSNTSFSSSVPYSIPSAGDYYGEYPLLCNFPGEIVLRGGFPMPSLKESDYSRSNICSESGLKPG